VEGHKSFTDGPTDAIERTFDLKIYQSKVNDATTTATTTTTTTTTPSPSSIAAFVPNSSGRWLRRRKNDGALNRVPDKFYPRVWNILSRSSGFRVGTHVLPRDPIVSEKTPEEFNFALAVENFLGAIVDPAERQIAVETLMVIAKIEDRNPGMEVQPDVIDLPLIMREAMEIFWTRWIVNGLAGREQTTTAAAAGGGAGGAGGAGQEGLPVASVLSALGDRSFSNHEQLAQRMFYDLPQEGKEGTLAYLARAVLKLLPYSIDFE